MYRYFFKPLFDFLMAFVALVLLLPLFLILVLAIKIDSRGPIFFKQLRVGKNKKLFKIYKFRTMRIDTPKDMPTHLLGDPSRYITKVGKFLRKTSLDELPQIFNILFGKMSIIGPRPALWNQDDLIAARDEHGANAVRPGLTGWAQVNGRDELLIADKARLDGEYIKRMGFFFDCKIFFKTVGKVFRSEGVVEGGTGTLEKSGKAVGMQEGADGEPIEMERIVEEATSVQEEIITMQGTDIEEAKVDGDAEQSIDSVETDHQEDKEAEIEEDIDNRRE